MSLRVAAALFLMISLPACAQAAPFSPTAVIPEITQVSPTPLPSSTPNTLPSKTALPALTVTPPCEYDQWCTAPALFPLAYPILPPDNDRIAASYPFGSTRNGTVEVHHGVEFVNPSGTPVHAAADGRVVFAGKDDQQAFGPFTGYYGNLVILEHHLPGSPDPLFTLYGHLSSVLVKNNQQVRVGDLLGEVGLSGVADGAHLHFEVRAGENDYAHSVNPQLFLPPQPDEFKALPTGILVGRISNSSGDPIRVRLSVTRLPGKGETEIIWYPELYGEGVMSSESYHENFLLGGLREGKYRLVFYYHSRYYDQTVEVVPGNITSVDIMTK